MANLGNTLDAIFKPEWLALVHGVEALAGKAEGEIVSGLQTAQTELSTALTNAASAVTAAQGTATAAVNQVANTAIAAAGTALTAAYPPIGPLVAAAEPQVDTLADDGTDALLNAVINWAAARLSSAAKTVAAVNLSNLAGAVANPPA